MKRIFWLLVVAVLLSAQVTGPSPVGINGSQGAISGSANGITGTIPLVASVQVPHGDLLCTTAGDYTIGKVAVTGVITGNPTVITGAIGLFINGTPVQLSGFADAGFNGKYVIVNQTNNYNTTNISLNSTALTYTGAGTPAASYACSNTTDIPGGGASFATTYVAPPNAFLASGKQLRLDAEFQIWTAAIPGNLAMGWSQDAATSGSWYNNGAAPTANLSAGSIFTSFNAVLEETATGPPGPIGNTFVIAGGGSFPVPGWPTNVSNNTQTAPVALAMDTTQPITHFPRYRPAINGTGGTITVTQGSAVSTGAQGTACLASATGTQNSGSGAVWIFTLNALNSVAGSQTFQRPPVVGTNAGSGYASVPTATWTLSIPTAAQAAAANITPATACSGVATATGGTLGGSMGNAMSLLNLRATWFN